MKRAKRYKEPLSIAIIDIDKFKDFNDTFGHLIGDEVLISLAQTVNISLRETDTFARWGGEEFVILFGNTSVDIAQNVSLKIKDKIEQNEHLTAGKITASFGLTQYIKHDTIEIMFKRCDDALYVAKKMEEIRLK
ncbi:MAG TPA: GGDEF domain-containing protein [Arcobacter sp.]|nr:GGDEF domain-containing protein [Arcobacter sp.]